LISRFPALLLVVTSGGCAALPDIPADACGNHVVEPGEDCDGLAVLVTTTATPREFGPPRTLADLQHGSGIVAADVDGDGVQDLAIAASGNLSVLKASLVGP
jgi:FG-GAP repeat